MEFNEVLEQYRAAAHRQRFNYESHGGPASNEVHSLDARNWTKLACFWYLIKAGVVMNIPKGVHMKLLSRQVRRECESMIDRYAIDLKTAAEKSDQWEALATFNDMGRTDANLQST